MSIENESFGHNYWDDFVVFSSKESLNASELYESYKILKKRFSALPKAELIKRGWISSADDIASLTDYFKDIYSEKEITLFRKSDSANIALASLWLSKVKSYAEMKVMVQSIPKFEKISKSDLTSIAHMSVDVDVIKVLPDILSKFGIVLIYNKALPSMKLDGAVFKLASGNPVIGMSLRYSRLDNFWFTLMHELAHVHLHNHLLDNPILDDFEIDSSDEIEIAANRLAKNSFVSRDVWRNCEPKYDKSLKAIEKFSNEIKVHKSIVAGMLRKEEGNFSIYSDIVNHINVGEIIFGDD